MAFTFFFRDRHTLEHLANLLIEKYINNDEIRIWDAGCAMGQEPYTLSIMLSEKMSSNDYKKIKIMATDIDENDYYAPIVRDAIYPLDQLTRIPDGILEKYFLKYDENNNYQLSEKVRNSLQFLKHDLLQLKPVQGKFEAVVCKNVLLHFNHQQQIDVLEMYYNSLVPGGFLINEQTQQIPIEIAHKFGKILSDANIYQKL